MYRNLSWWHWCRYKLTAHSTRWHTLHKDNRISHIVQADRSLYISRYTFNKRDTSVLQHWIFSLINSTTLCPFLPSAHDSDVKEANKQKCQQQGQQPQQQGQAVYHSSGQAATVPQYLHRPSMQFPQQAPQPGLALNHRPASYLSHSSSLQAPNGPQHGNAQAITASLDPKSNIPNRAYQVSMHYTCAAPCFDR